MSWTLSDNELVTATLQNPETYTVLVDRYEMQLIRYIRRMIGDEHEISEDITQEVFIKAYRSLNSYNSKLKFSSWIYRITHNLCVDYLRKNNKKRHVSLDIEDEESQALLQKIASNDNVSENLTSQETRKAIQDIIATLPEKYKIVIVLAFMEDKSYGEISDILQIPIGTVWTLINRAKKHFFALATEPQFSHLFPYVQTQ